MIIHLWLALTLINLVIALIGGEFHLTMAWASCTCALILNYLPRTDEC